MIPTAEVAVAGSECPEEREAQSSASGGPVVDSETLCRFVHHRLHLDKRGLLDPRAVPLQDLTQPARGGMSVTRLEQSSPEEFERVARDFNRRSVDFPVRCFVTGTRAVRSMKSEDRSRIFCVIDAATPDNDAHALIRFDRAHPQKSSARRYRDQLLEAFRPAGGSGHSVASALAGGSQRSS